MKRKLIGPFVQLLTMDHLPINGPLKDSQLEIVENGGVVVEEGIIKEIGQYNELKKKKIPHDEIPYPAVLLPGLIDAHTHICFAGSRAKDYALRVSGVSYQEIAQQGGGIIDTVRKTRAASQDELTSLMLERTKRLLKNGVTTCEVKSGYGLTFEDEIKMLEVIGRLGQMQPVTLVSTCLAAHIIPPEFKSGKEYLSFLIKKLLPIVKEKRLSKRVDIFIEKGAFSPDEALYYLKAAREMGFSICIHADQFTRGGAQVAAQIKAVSADHLEMSVDEDFLALSRSVTIPIVLPGASMGLGMPFAPARKMLDEGLSVVLASDWNPGSAPMGNLLLEAAVIGAAEKLTMAETFASMTVRAAKALELDDRGVIKKGMRADFVAYPCDDYREILYHQGSLIPSDVFVKGEKL